MCFWVNTHRWNKSPRAKCVVHSGQKSCCPLQRLYSARQKANQTAGIGENKEKAWWKTDMSCKFEKVTLWTHLHMCVALHLLGSVCLLTHGIHTAHTWRHNLCTQMFQRFSKHQIRDSERALELIMWCMMLRKDISRTLFEPLYLVEDVIKMRGKDYLLKSIKRCLGFCQPSGQSSTLNIVLNYIQFVLMCCRTKSNQLDVVFALVISNISNIF